MALRAGQALSLGRVPDAALLAQLAAEYDPECGPAQPTPAPAGHAPLNVPLARRLADDPRLFLLPPHTPHLSWIIYGFFLHEGLGRCIDTYRLALDCARRYRPFAVPVPATTAALRALWKSQHRDRALERTPVSGLSAELLLSLPALDPSAIRLWLLRARRLRSETAITPSQGSSARLLAIDAAVSGLGVRGGDHLIWAVVATDNPARGRSLHGLHVDTSDPAASRPEVDTMT
ncbi:hypothetical protein DFI_18265 (plasmid) [Deinococcus ficus]|uniref:Uncharacterized protein n=1 Tax=Deinococcus ficus TaxID=317577 RepID=A0A221T2R7_9DEIO|nr:hypothetical protein DFI_18265 [Deinococcus ficus]